MVHFLHFSPAKSCGVSLIHGQKSILLLSEFWPPGCEKPDASNVLFASPLASQPGGKFSLWCHCTFSSQLPVLLDCLRGIYRDVCGFESPCVYLMQRDPHTYFIHASCEGLFVKWYFENDFEKSECQAPSNVKQDPPGNDISKETYQRHIQNRPLF